MPQESTTPDLVELLRALVEAGNRRDFDEYMGLRYRSCSPQTPYRTVGFFMPESVSSRLARLFSSALEDKHLRSNDGRLAGRREGALRCQLELLGVLEQALARGGELDLDLCCPSCREAPSTRCDENRLGLRLLGEQLLARRHLVPVDHSGA